MARVALTSSSIGWDTLTDAPLCSVTLYYDDVSLLLQDAEVVNGSDDTVATFALEDTTKPMNDPNRKAEKQVPKGTVHAVTPIIPIPLTRTKGKQGEPDRISLPPGLAFSFSAPVQKVKPVVREG